MLNEAGAIERCIESLLAQDYPRELLEIIVVDGLSTDGSRAQVAKLIESHNLIRLLDNPARRTPVSLNIGIKKAKGDVIIILGAHTRVNHNFVRLNIECMRSLQVRCTGGTQINVGETSMQKAIGYAMGSSFGIPSAPYRFRNKSAFVDTVVYAAYDRKLFEEVGYFDEQLHISEDAELNWRIRKAGHRIYYCPEIVSHYYPRKTIARLVKQFFNYGILRANVVKKHRDAFKWIHAVPPLFIAISLALLVAGLLQPLSWKVLLPLWVIYLSYVLFATVITALKNRDLSATPRLPLAFIAMQLSWGLGFIAGLFKTYK